MGAPKVDPDLKRDEVAKTGVRYVERKLLERVAADWGVKYSDVLYIAAMRLLVTECPHQAAELGIRVPLLVGRGA